MTRRRRPSPGGSSSLSRTRTEAVGRRRRRTTPVAVSCTLCGSTSSSAMGLAGIVNAAMLVVAGQLFAGEHGGATTSLQQPHSDLAILLGAGAALAFALALLVVMSGFLRKGVPLPLRRTLTVLPALLNMVR